ncbi:MAG TPA: hypothetical protein ENH82_20400 [bacterium]|nr:hypothetical protein [bacterium]
MNTFNLLILLDAIGFHTIKMLISLLWQSSILIGVISLIVFILKKRSAAIRHILWTSLLTLLPVIPILAWLASVIGTPQAEIHVIPSYTAPVSAFMEKPVDEALISYSNENQESTRITSFSPSDYPWAVAFLLYAVGALFFLSLVALGRLRIRRWIYDGTVITEQRIIYAFQAARERLGIGRKFIAVEHHDIPAPLTIGTFHPVVLLPAGFTKHLSDTELQSLAIHEFSHIKRNDALIFTFVSIVRALFFFHPLVWFAAHQVATLAENACDDAVLGASEDSLVYAEMLTKMASKLKKRMFTAELAAGFIFSKHSFLRRVEVILIGRKEQIRKLSRLALVGIMIGIGASLMVILAFPLGEVKEANSERAKNSSINQPEDTVTDFTGGKAQMIDPTELGGFVYDEEGKPLEGVLVDAWIWSPGHEAYTNKDGRFKITGLRKHMPVEIRFTKEGYSPRFILNQNVGVDNVIVRLGIKTYFEGKVFDSHGYPVPNALVRADQGAKNSRLNHISFIWTETRTNKDGSYILHVEPDTYDIQVKAHDIGVARIREKPIAKDQAKILNFKLKPGVTFKAKFVNSRTEKSVEGVKLYSYISKVWKLKSEKIEAVSDKNGFIEIRGMMPGPYEFGVEAEGITRWWSKKAMHKHQHRMISKRSGWQRNFDALEFDLKPGMNPVTIVVEDGVKITGHVVDPDGNPVVGTTVAPARTGTGNSITGDTRFSVLTKDDGTFEMWLPASGKAEYNLVAHYGDYREWKTWANGIMEPIKTKPGQVIRDVTIALTRPATVRGQVKDENGKPLSQHQVRAHAADLKANRYYDPLTRTDDQGNFTINFIRPGKHFIQADPFWLSAKEAPEWSTETVTLKSGEVRDGIILVGNKTPERK